MMINPDAFPQVDIPFMNNTHKEEVLLLKKIGELIGLCQKTEVINDETNEQINRLLTEWLQHTQAHFSKENSLMLKYQFPAYAVHSNAHELELQQLQEIISSWKNNRNIEELAEYVFNDWPAWFNQHVSTMDLMTARFCLMNGYQEGDEKTLDTEAVEDA